MRILSLEEKEKISRNMIVKSAATRLPSHKSIDEDSSHLVDGCVDLLSRNVNIVETLSCRLNDFENRVSALEKVLNSPKRVSFLKRIVGYVGLFLTQE